MVYVAERYVYSSGKDESVRWREILQSLVSKIGTKEPEHDCAHKTIYKREVCVCVIIIIIIIIVCRRSV